MPRCAIVLPLLALSIPKVQTLLHFDAADAPMCDSVAAFSAQRLKNAIALALLALNVSKVQTLLRSEGADASMCNSVAAFSAQHLKSASTIAF